MAGGIQNDITLWLQVKQGDRTAFDRIYRLYASTVFALVYKHIHSRADAEDITQEVFLDMWEKRMSINIQSSFFNYLYSVARNRTLRYLKTNTNRPESLELFHELLQAEHLQVVYQETHSASAIRNIESSVADEVEGLPEQMKKVYRLSNEAGMSNTEIASFLQISPHTVKNHLSKVRKRLRLAFSRLTCLLFTLLLLLITTRSLLF